MVAVFGGAAVQGDRELFRRAKMKWAWHEQARFERRHGIVNAGRKKHRYKAGHLIDPQRLAWVDPHRYWKWHLQDISYDGLSLPWAEQEASKKL